MVEVIGITGGIGAGKSVVSRILRLMGYPVYDCDSEAKRLMEESEGLRNNLRFLLGEEAYMGRRLNKEYISGKIFSDRELRDGVNRFVHKAVSVDFLEYASYVGGTVFVESAILSTSGLSDNCTEIWLVDAPERVRIERVKARNGISADAVAKRMAAQREEFAALPQEKTKLITNDGTQPVIPAIRRLLGQTDEECRLQIEI